MDSFFMVVAACECLVLLSSAATWMQSAALRQGLYVLAFLFWLPIVFVLRRDRTTVVARPVKPAAPDLGRTLAVALPENVVVHFRLAPSMKRLGAALIDLALTTAALAVATLLFASLLRGFLPYSLRGQDTLLMLALLAVLLHGFWYEYFHEGQTTGKKRFGLRVIHVSGRPLEAPEALMRSALRLPFFLPFPLIFHSLELWATAILPVLFLELALIASSHWVQRLGDLAAGSVVIVDPR